MVRVGPQSSVNERLVALEIIRQILVLRVSLHVRNLVIKAINDTEQPVARMVRDAVRSDAGLRSPAQVQELDALIQQINAIRAPAWQKGAQTAQEQLSALAQAEPEDQRDMFSYLLPGIQLTLPDNTDSNALALPFQGRTLAQWFADLITDDGRRIRQALYLGVAAGLSAGALARKIVGSAGAKGTDGATQVSRNHIDSIIRSASVHFGASARDQFYRANQGVRYVLLPPGAPKAPIRGVGAPADAITAELIRQAIQAADIADSLAGGRGKGGTQVFTWEQYVAILDSRTTQLCRGLDGKLFKIGVGPIPPLHIGCRSNRIIVLPKSIGGDRFDPGTYSSWIGLQPDEVQTTFGATALKRKGQLVDTAFRDYGTRPMTLKQARTEARRLMEFY